MGQKQAKEKLFYSIEKAQLKEMLAILHVRQFNSNPSQQFPEIID